MEEAPKRSGWKIWVYLIPVYIIIAIPLVKWTLKNQSGEIAVSKEDFSAFNSEEGEIKKADLSGYNPQLADRGYSVRYRAGGSPEGSKDEYDMGYVPGRMLRTLGDYMGKPKSLEELFNNRWVVKGFLARASSKRALANPAALKAFLSNRALVGKFLTDKTVTAALDDQKIFDLIADSDFAKTLLETPAAQSLMKDAGAVRQLANSDPAISGLLRRPAIRSAVVASPQTASLARALGWK